MRGGELLGTFETLVNPGVPIPPMITVLTGITDAMLLPAPKIDEVLPAFLEFAQGAVIVGHNVRFDVSFLDAALRRARLPAARAPARRHRRARAPARPRRGAEPAPVDARPPLPHVRRAGAPRVLRRGRDRGGAALAAGTGRGVRRARPRRPGGAADDARAPVGGQARAHGQAAPAARRLPLPRPGGAGALRRQGDQPARAGPLVLLDRGPPQGPAAAAGDRAHRAPRVPGTVRSGDPRAAPDPAARTALQPRVEVEARRRTSSSRRSGSRASSSRTSRAPTARSTSDRSGRARPRTARGKRSKTRCRSAGAARASGSKTAIEHGPPCVPAQLGVATCPCRGQIDEEEYAALADVVRRGLGEDPALLCAPLEARMHRLADSERFEEAAATRDRLATLAQALQRQRAMDALRAAERARARQRRRPTRARVRARRARRDDGARRPSAARSRRAARHGGGRRADAREPLAQASARRALRATRSARPPRGCHRSPITRVRDD